MEKSYKYGAFENASYFTTKQLYITPKLLVNATCGNIDNGYEPYVVYTEKDLKKIMTMVSSDLTSKDMSMLGSMATAAGVLILFINPGTGVLGAILTVSGNVATIGGGLALGWNLLEIANIKDFEMAAREGNLHLCYNVYACHKSYNNYEPWVTTGYINRIQVGTPGNITCRLSYQDVQTECGFTNYDN